MCFAAGAFGVQCPPPEALEVIEYENGEELAIIERNVVNDKVAVHWTKPALSGTIIFTNCYTTSSPNMVCESGDEFPITDTFTFYEGKILVDIHVIQGQASSCKFYIRVRGKLASHLFCCIER